MLTQPKPPAPQPGNNEVPHPTLDRRFLVQLKGKDYVTYAGLLDLAHQNGLQKLTVEAVQFPTPDNGMEAILTACAVLESGKVFTDIGDANPQNTSNTVGQHLIRMASTRAKARVLRDITNIGITALEELGGEMPDNGNAFPRKTKTPLKPVNGGAVTPITDAQKRAIWKLAQAKGYDENSLNDFVVKTYGCGVPALNIKDASALITQLQQGG